MMNAVLRFLVLAITVGVSVGCDQITKMMAQSHLRGHASRSFVDGVFHLVYAENSGTVLGVGSALPADIRYLLFVIVLGAVLVAAIAFVLLKPLRYVTVLAISLVVGGGLSNILDRLIHNGSVVDFMVIRFGSLESGIFNVADVAITLGIGLLILSLIGSKGQEA